MPAMDGELRPRPAGAVRLEVRESTLLLLDVERNELFLFRPTTEVAIVFRFACEPVPPAPR